ncbi:MAG: GDP-mannose 4,6-dehydratase [Melioribacteraceae bacterium]|nr:GDP-mannose 4,6-dehydratase [Melioribacteraceae bacterium]
MPQRGAFGKKGIIKSINRNIPLFQSSNIPNPKFDIGDIIIEVNPRYYRPTEVELLIGNPQKAKDGLDWEAKTKFDELAKMMAKEDYKKVLKKGF